VRLLVLLSLSLLLAGAAASGTGTRKVVPRPAGSPRVRPRASLVQFVRFPAADS
jgi:hypothetical protein